MMKKIVFTLVLILGVCILNAQKSKPLTNNKNKTDDFSIVLKESEKQNINWQLVRDFFSEKKENDSIQFSVKLNTSRTQNLKSEKKYTVSGIRKNIDELISVLQKMLKD